MNKFVFVVLISAVARFVAPFLKRQRYKGLALVGDKKTIGFGGWLVMLGLELLIRTN